MSRLELVDHATAVGRTRELLDAVEKKLGVVPNMTRALAQSPAVLDAYLSFSGALAATSLSAKVREQLALAVGEVNSCDYCLSAHSTIGAKLGLSSEEVRDARRGRAADEKTGAVLALARELVLKRGEVSDETLRGARAAGVTDGEVAEVVAITALNIFTNYFNHVADTPIDFPEVRAGDAGDAGAENVLDRRMRGDPMRTAVVILSDPKSGSEESLGRLFNGLSLAAEAKRADDEVAVVFAGAGTRWPGELTALGHPARELYDSVRDVVRGASCGCAEVFGATDAVESCGVPLLKEHENGSASGLASLRRFAAEGWQTFVF